MAYQIIDDNSLSAIVKNIAQMVSYPEPVDPAVDTDTSVVQMVQAVNQSGYHLSLIPS